jgi:glycosyltransferase involved in cell wall biosynthesis
MGYDAWLVANGKQGEPPSKHPVIIASTEQLFDPSWWKAQKPDGIILNTWSAPRYDALRAAAMETTPHVVEVLDTDGIRSPSISFWDYFAGCHGRYREIGSPKYRQIFSPLIALARAFVIRSFPFLLDEPMAKTMKRVPRLAAQSPLAAARIARFMRTFVANSPPVHFVPHPVNDEYMRYSETILRENKICSVAGWHRYQKDFPLFIRSLILFLASQPKWRAEIIGQLPAGFDPTRIAAPRDVCDRITFRGHLEHEMIAGVNQSSKIFLVTSRYESFHIGAAEALCCGCSVVGPANIASMPFFISANSGTISHRRKAEHFADALNAEVIAWERGWRDPVQISKTWRERVGTGVVAEQLVQLLKST